MGGGHNGTGTQWDGGTTRTARIPRRPTTLPVYHDVSVFHLILLLFVVVVFFLFLTKSFSNMYVLCVLLGRVSIFGRDFTPFFVFCCCFFVGLFV